MAEAKDKIVAAVKDKIVVEVKDKISIAKTEGEVTVSKKSVAERRAEKRKKVIAIRIRHKGKPNGIKEQINVRVEKYSRMLR